MLCLAKVKFDLRDPDELYFARREIDSLLNTKTEFVKTIAYLVKKRPFNLLDEEVIHLMTRLIYLGEGQGFLAKIPLREVVSIVKRATFFREIYVICEARNNLEVLKGLLNKIGLAISNEQLEMRKIDLNPYTHIFLKDLSSERKLIAIRFLPFQTLFEYVTEVKKLPAAVFRPRNSENWEDYFKEKENGVEKGVKELLEHMKQGHYHSPHFGLGKNYVGDFVDWASTDLRKPFLHYLHKYKGKGDPRISRALINLLHVEDGDTILDPFVGSGAFIADASTMGLNAIGIEVLNIGKMISEVKCNLGIDVASLRNSIIKLFESMDDMLSKQNAGNELAQVKRKIKETTGDSSSYENINLHLPQIVFLKKRIETIDDKEAKTFLLTLLSQEIVEYSEKKRNWSITNSFKSYVEDRYLTLYATKKLAEILDIDLNKGKTTIIKGDSTNMSMIKNNSISGILTSPPYFDALDYIGNNKISILILDLDQDLIWGSTKQFYEAKYRDEREYQMLPLFVSDRYFSIQLPATSLELITLLQGSHRGYKSKVVENYLKMMGLSFEECYRVLRKNKYYLMVVSKYQTWTINGKEQTIETSSILADLGKSVGFKVVDIIQHGLSKADKGRIGVEDIIVFQK
jgi:tRNA G10  N-methylase Trm11